MRITIAIVLILVTAKLFGQDRIIRTNGDTITGYISIVEKEEIKYRKVDDRSQPVYSIKKTLVDRIVYENGEVEKMEVPAEVRQAENYNMRHRLSWVYTDVFIARLMVSYEYLNKSGSVGLRVPLAVGVPLQMIGGGETGINAVGGLDVNIYPTTARGLAKYYFGPMMRVGYSTSDFWNDQENMYYSLMFGNGVSINVTHRLNMSAYMGVGVKYTRYFDPIYYYYDYTGEPSSEKYSAIYPNVVFGFSVGYNFIKK